MTDLYERTDVRRDPDGKLPVDKVVFGIAAALSIAFVISGVVAPETMGSGTSKVLNWITDSFGWLFVLTSASFVIFSAYLAISRTATSGSGSTTPSRSSRRSPGSR